MQLTRKEQTVVAVPLEKRLSFEAHHVFELVLPENQDVRRLSRLPRRGFRLFTPIVIEKFGHTNLVLEEPGRLGKGPPRQIRRR